MHTLEVIESIKQLKARYFRALDTKDWPLMKTCLASQCIAKYDGGKYSFEGRENIARFFSSYMDDPNLIFMHQGHHPEITIINSTKAKGIWYLQDMVINLNNQTTLQGAGFYHDEYILEDDIWYISATGYERTFEEISERKNITTTFNRFTRQPDQA